MYSIDNLFAQSEAHLMSSILALHAATTGRFDKKPGARLGARKRMVTLQPGKKSRLVFLTEPEGLAVEQYKILRHRLRTLHPDGGVMLVTSPSPGEGKTLTSVNLAFCLAEGGHETCLVDLDFRAPGVSSALGYQFEEDGIEDVLNGERTIVEAARQLGERPLHVLGVRKCLISPGYYFTPEVLTPVLNSLRAMFRWVILDFAPVIPMADVAEIAPQVDGALLVVRTGKTDKSMITPCIETLGSKLWGVVVNDSPISGSSYYGYYGKHRD
jgi:capsular exopolysaccharide synthesis family protein